eukprot:TRINITY_DN4856_c0_g1_i1.p1 TRINITY_DN4856_c0_g1~~TRINITY_DN4856_c0_g1_i1.p1  ORF type:complete len:698 (-),score=128.01 TRINITY_DN4856_c0_g1_i1:14-2107(-)
MGRTKGFKIGPTVKPTTRGLWMWSKPYERISPTNETEYIIFLDSEGLFASNVTEIYDAKIFAVATLLSSYLVYNSVKLIDQSAIDYMEILVRRAQLFSLRTNLFTPDDNSDTGEVVEENLRRELEMSETEFPELMWIIQDFYQDLVGQTPDEWLHDLLRQRKKNSGVSSLSEIFPKISCRTLFLPQVTVQNLRYLDEVPHDKLTQEYQQEISLIRDSVRKNAPIKKRNGKSLNGVGISALLLALVQSANEGNFPQIPDLWSTFLNQTANQATMETLNIFESMLKNHTQNAVFGTQEFEEIVDDLTETSMSAFNKLSLGFEEISDKFLPILTDKLKKIKSTYNTINNNNVKIKCKELRDTLFIKFVDLMTKLDLPTSTQAIQNIANQKKSQILSEFDESTIKYSQICSTEREKVVVDLDRELNNTLYQNTEKISSTIKSAKRESLKIIDKQISDLEKGLTTEDLKLFKKKLSQMAHDKYDSFVSGFPHESVVVMQKTSLDTDLADHFGKLESLNNIKVLNHITYAVDESKKVWQQLNIKYPITSYEINKIIEDNHKQSIKLFNQLVEQYSDYTQYSEGVTKLQNIYNLELKTAIETNELRLKANTKEAYDAVKKKLYADSKNYYFESSFRNHAAEILSQEIAARNLLNSKDLIDTVIQKLVDQIMKDYDINYYTISDAIIIGASTVIVMVIFAKVIRL